MPYYGLCRGQIERKLLREAFPTAEMAVFDRRFLCERYQQQKIHKAQANKRGVSKESTKRRQTDEARAMDKAAGDRSFGVDTVAAELPETALGGHRDFPGQGILGPALQVFALRYTKSLVTWLSRCVTRYQIQH